MSARVTSLAYRRALRLRHQTGGQGSEVEQKLEPIYVELGARGIGLMRPGKTLYETLKDL